MKQSQKFNFGKLKNGVRYIIVPMVGVESVAVGVYVRTGSRYETEKINGLSHFLEHMVFKGTKKFPSHIQTSYLEGLGAIQNAWTDVDGTAYWCKIVSDKWYQGLELVSDLALNPLIPERDLEIERGVILEEINRRDDRPDEIVSEVLQSSLFAGNPLGRTTLGSAKVIRGVTRNDFLDYHRQQYVSGRLIVVIAGKLEKTEEIEQAIEKIFGELPAKLGKDFEKVTESTASSQVGIHVKKTADQVHFEFGVRAYNSQDNKRFALAVLTAYLGQGLSSRLFTELREKRGLCYSVHAAANQLEDVGMWNVYAGVAKDKFPAAVKAVWEEMKRLKHEKLTKSELQMAKEKLRGHLLFSKENPIHQMEFYARQLLNNKEKLYDYDTLLTSLMGVDEDQIREVARELFNLEKLKLAVVGETTEKAALKTVQDLRE